MLASSAPLLRELDRTLPVRPFAIECWDGERLVSTTGEGPIFRVRSAAAVAHALRAPGQLGIGRAYTAVAGVLEPDDLDSALALLSTWKPPSLARATRDRLAVAAARAFGVMLPPRPPAGELRPRGRRHSRDRDARAVSHHYDVSNEFFALFLDPSMTYSCAIFSRGAQTLAAAQEAKLELVCRKLEPERFVPRLDSRPAVSGAPNFRARVVAAGRAFRCGDTGALEWRSDVRLRAILDRAAQREHEDREKDLLPIP